jgi:hypothetical protein
MNNNRGDYPAINALQLKAMPLEEGIRSIGEPSSRSSMRVARSGESRRAGSQRSAEARSLVTAR